jgi:soluble lytic murein transglycosylase-like protein
VTIRDVVFAGVRWSTKLIVLSVSLVLWAQASADVFQFIDDDGIPHFSDQLSDPRYRAIVETGNKSSGLPASRSDSSLREARQRLAPDIAATAAAHRIDAALLSAVVEVESGYNASAISRKGAMGLMQLMPDTARRYGVVNPMDALQNLNGGARLLRDLLDQLGDSKALALAAYNAGAGAVISHGHRIPPFPETARYVPEVLRRYEFQLSQTATAAPGKI